MSVAIRYDNDINTAKDVLQNTFIKIFNNLKKFDSEKGNFNQWSKRILINEILILKRKNKELLNGNIYLDIKSYTEIDLLDKMTVKELKKVIDKLPYVHKVILNLYYFEDYSHKEIAKILGIKESSSRSQLSVSRKLLRAEWKQQNLIIVK